MKRNTQYAILNTYFKEMQKTKNIFIKIEYAGTRYNGWQSQSKKSSVISQKKTITIQQTIEAALAQILQQRINLNASGRTDSGVHAKAQCANFKADISISLLKLKTALNSILPDDIRIKAVKYVDSRFHCRYNAKSKVYRYIILNNKEGSAFLRETAAHVYKPLDFKLMQKEARALKGKHDFKSFQATDKKERTSIRTIKAIDLKKRGSLICVDIEADGFLYNMVRNIVGTLIEIGRGKMKSRGLKYILDKKNRKYAGPTAPAKGLQLLKVKY